MAFTATTPIKDVSIAYNGNTLSTLWVRSDESSRQRLILGFGGDAYPGSSTVQGLALAALQTQYATDDGLQDADGNATPIRINNLPFGILHDELENYGYENPLIDGSHDRWLNKQQVDGAFLKHATAEVDTDTGRIDVKHSGGYIPIKGVSATGEMQQSTEDWTASLNGSSLNLRLYARSGETYAGTDLITDDSRVEAMVRLLEANRSSGAELIITATRNLDGLHAMIAAAIFTIDQDISTTTNEIEFLLTGSSRSATFINLTFAVTTGTLDVGLMNALLNATTVGIPSDDPIEEPPVGASDVRLHAERIEFGDGQLVSEDGIPNWRVAGRSHSLGGAYGKTIQLEELTLETAGHYTIPWTNREAVYDLQAAHIASDDAVVIRLHSIKEMVPNTGESADLEFHNDNDVGGETVEIQDVDGR